MEHMSGPIGVVPFYDKFIRDKSDLWKTALCEIQGHPQIADEFIKAYHHDYKHAKYDTTRQLYIDAEKLVQTHASQFEKPDFHGDVAYVMYRALTHAISSMQMAKEAEKPRDQIRARLAASFDALIGNSRRLRLAALNDVDHTVPAGRTIEIPVHTKHRVRNDSAAPVVFIEVQTGTYFGEDDIVRYEDDYGRAGS